MSHTFTIRLRPHLLLSTPHHTCLLLAVSMALLCSPAHAAQHQSQQDQSQAQSTDPAKRAGANPNDLPESTFAARGKKLMLKDGSYQLVREYQQKGDTVRYYSVERSQWEEIPASLVDWDATKKAEAQQKTDADAYIEKVQKSEAQHHATEVTDVDSSLEVAPGVFLPTDEGLFLVIGKTITTLQQSRTDEKLDRKQEVKKVLTPVPLVSSKHYMEIPNKHSTVRVTVKDPEFYMRIPYNSDEDPEIELMRADIKGDRRVVQVVSTNIAGQNDYQRHTLSLQRWNVAQGVYRFTLGEDLPPGEYALAVILPEGINMFVWDFGVDPAPTPAAASAAKPH